MYKVYMQPRTRTPVPVLVDAARRLRLADAARRLLVVANGGPYEGTFVLAEMREDLKVVLAALEDALGLGIFGPDPEVKP